MTAIIASAQARLASGRITPRQFAAIVAWAKS